MSVTQTAEADPIELLRVFSHKYVKGALRALDSVDRTEDRLSGVYEKVREFSRRSFRIPVTVVVPNEKQENPLAKGVRFEAFSRNLSESGLSIVYRGEIDSDRVIIGIGSGERTKWIESTVRRRRAVFEGFWEFGIRFESRTQAKK